MTHLVHVHPSFSPGGAEVRTADIINHLGPAFRHTLVALDGRFETARRIHSGIEVNCVTAARDRNPLRSISAFVKLFRKKRPDLVLSNNWGSMDAVVAAGWLRACPVIHTEDGFGTEEATRQKRRRVLFRRGALAGARCVIAPSHTLGRIMRQQWRLPEHKLRYIPNGIDTERFRPAPAGPEREESRETAGRNEVVVASVGHLRPEKCYHLLLEACAALRRTRPVRLLLAGDGPERPRLERLAQSLGFQDGVSFLGYQQDVRGVYAQCDIFALSSSTEQMPLSVLEAMASGLPVAATQVGDIREMVGEGNRPYICDAAGLAAAIGQLAGDATLRRQLGSANRQRAVEVYNLDHMCRIYAELYRGALMAGTTAD